MSSTPLKRRRVTIFVTGPNSKKIINPEEEGENSTDGKNITLQDVAFARQRTHNDLVVVNTANSIEILIQIFVDEFEILRHHIRESGQKMRNFFSKHFSTNKIRQLLQVFIKSKTKSMDYKRDVDVIFNQGALKMEESWKPPRYTLNDMEEVMTTDDLENGVIQRRTEKWECLPIRLRPEPADDSLCEFQRMNIPMSMTLEDDDEDRLSMPSTRTVMTTEDQMQAIQAQLAMLSKQLVNLQKTTTANIAKEERISSRASSRRGGRTIEKKSSVEITSTSSTSDTSEDEGKGASLCSPAHSLQRKAKSPKASIVPQITPVSIPEISHPIVSAAPNAPPPPPPLPPMGFMTKSLQKTPMKVATEKPNSNSQSLPPAEVVVSNRPYLTDIANGRSLLKKTTRSPGGSPMGNLSNNRRPLSSFEAALRDRFKGFHGDASFSEQEENDEDCNATWDE